MTPSRFGVGDWLGCLRLVGEHLSGSAKLAQLSEQTSAGKAI